MDNGTGDWRQMLIFSKPVWWTLGLIMLFGCGEDIRNTLENGSVDLRNRVVGARLLAAGEESYRYVWHPGDPERFLDPLTRWPNAPDNRVSVTPGVLAIYTILSELPYRHQQILWLVFQWAAALGTIALLAGAASSPMDRRFLVMVIAFLFFTGESWRFHVERGQVYVFYAFLFAASYRVGRGASRFSGFGCGLLLGFGVLLRPTVIVAGIPFLISKHRRILAGGACGMFLGAAILSPYATPGSWRSYLSGMASIGNFYLQTGHDVKHLRDATVLPRSVEGMENLSKAKKFDVSPVRLYACTFLLSPSLRERFLQGACLVFIFVFSVLLWRVRQRDGSLETCLLAGVTLMMGVDFFIPAPRQAYNNVVWAVPLGLLIVRGGAGSLFRGRIGSLLFIGLIFSCGVVKGGDLDTFGFAHLIVAICFIAMSIQTVSYSHKKACHAVL